MDQTSLPPKLPETKQYRWVWFVSGGILLALFVGCAVLISLIWRAGIQDDPRPDDSRMMPKWSKRGPTANPLETFCAEIRRKPAAEYSELREEVTKLKADNVRRAREIIAEHSAALEAFDKLTQTDSATWLWPDGEAITHPSYLVDYLDGCTAISHVACLKAKMLGLDGKPAEATRLALDVAKAGAAMQRAEGGTINLATAIGIHRKGMSQCLALAQSENFPRELLLQSLREISAMEGPRREDGKFALQGDYQFFLQGLEILRQGKGASGALEDLARLPKYLLKPHRTIKMRLGKDLPVQEGLDQGWREGFAAAVRAEEYYDSVALRERSIGFYADSNFVGKCYFVMTSSVTKPLLRGVMNGAAIREQYKVLLALRLYELDQGHLPELLDALVPTYLPAVPEDIYTGKPMLWRLDKKIVYSTGENGRDDGGAINQAQPLKGLDVGKLYPWGAASSASRD
jgi:hypothetical protein